ncbi:uncharacterized protein LOC123300026 isoform X2 [Chrysoperla carnea]|uniref:uncharacterized protein LOC123300026 isoform X2 n=1 Tax=Chrysoperla carnea TaxID=189513 RepID=UPI001D069958|nr:uncharacterized protein LOC123300026 isoform X2 [Chrysoperla carnea]
MRFAIALFLVAALAVTVLSAPPEKKDLKQIKEEARQKQKCVKSCDEKTEAICAGVDGEKPLSFGSQCVLDNYNCENGKSKIKEN